MAVTMEEVLRGMPAENIVSKLTKPVSEGELVFLRDGSYSFDDTIAVVENGLVTQVYGVAEGQLEFQFEGI